MIDLTVNGEIHRLDVDPATPLLYVLRGELKLNSVKFGCGLGQCGACTVVADGQAIYACLVPVVVLQGRKITTLEGLGSAHNPSPLQRAFIDEQAAQCGYCIPGMIMRAYALLSKKVSPSETEIRTHMASNLCRCGTHMRILRAIRRASSAMRTAQAGPTGEAGR